MAKTIEPLIFVVEDNNFYLDLIKSNLQEMNHSNIMAFLSGEECLENLHKNPEIVILDFNLTGINGIEVLQKIKRHNTDTEVIFLSTQKDINVAVNSLKYGAYDYIEKNEKTFYILNEMLEKIILSKKEKKKKGKRKFF